MSGQPHPDRLVLCAFADLLTRPPAPWMVRGVLREQSVGLLYGQRGGFKSFIALDLAASLATGLPWQGHEVVRSGLVIYVAGEGGGGMVQRARAWAEQHEVNPRSVNMLFVTEPAIITADSDDIDLLIERIRDAIEWQPEGTFDPETGHTAEHDEAREWPVLIVIDTLARCFLGNENAQEDMNMFVQGVDRLKIEFNCSLLILHHSGRDDSHERGSTNLGGACDTIYRLDADRDSHTLTITNEKMKDGREPDPLELAYREVHVQRRPDDDPLEDLTSLVIESAAASADEKLAALLQILMEEGPLTWGAWFEVSQMPRATFGRMVVRLKEMGQIIKENGIWRVV